MSFIYFSGVNCEEDIDECLSNPCVHGDCTNGPASYLCHCDKRWTGKNCDIELDPCKSNPCLNNAKCSVTSDYRDFSCHCQSGFTGWYHNTWIIHCIDLIYQIWKDFSRLSFGGIG